MFREEDDKQNYTDYIIGFNTFAKLILIQIFLIIIYKQCWPEDFAKVYSRVSPQFLTIRTLLQHSCLSGCFFHDNFSQLFWSIFFSFKASKFYCGITAIPNVNYCSEVFSNIAALKKFEYSHENISGLMSFQ